MNKKEIRNHLNSAIEKQIPNDWDRLEAKLNKSMKADQVFHHIVHSQQDKRKQLTKKLSVSLAALAVAFIMISFTPVIAQLQALYDQIFTSDHIDDPGVKIALESGIGQTIDQTFYDEENDISVHFQNIMTDDKETKLLLTFLSEETNLENYYLDLFEGSTTIQLQTENGQTIPLDNVGWGSRYYQADKNKVVTALSFAPIKEYIGQNIRLEIHDITVYNDQSTENVEATWPLDFTLEKTAASDRSVLDVDKQFTLQGESYHIKQVEFSPLETRIIFTGSDIHYYTDESGEIYEIFSKLEHQFLNARVIDKENGYGVDYNKPGVFLSVNGEKVAPNFSKGEIKQANGTEYVMVFAPVKERDNLVLEVGEGIEIKLGE
ncbi:DUF4179 domain-containing protein [Gracilibacillus oryzae]|uniref:DUF4179 domain-containing protein n=1 Tax=Gracilibacillus oryzae TaxID=1672701 RepID=A0A7C8KQI3_9BACI|nr:DUF4179 domain-containing protein [Gracilibacillus oryzae]KAB8137484.1 DUF4179 domain-containing protein [Gracilibacillus oryzae]